MKLRTEMAKWSDGNMYPSVHGEREVYGMLEHDAACAHALMLAIENRVKRAEDADQLQEQVTLRGIKRFANELMREWGFDSGEDAE